MVNVLFNDFSYEILPKQLETFDKYSKILQWGRANPTRFLEDFVGLKFTENMYCYQVGFLLMQSGYAVVQQVRALCLRLLLWLEVY